ncbi:MAG TPA: hypothetical protein VKA43_00900 [Gammaproteobacteria bacterium]|nr:hypothetical protein [Gammaproteobacteria bacterium]
MANPSPARCTICGRGEERNLDLATLIGLVGSCIVMPTAIVLGC